MFGPWNSWNQKTEACERIVEPRICKTGNVTMEEMEPHHFLLRMFQSEFSVQVNQLERQERCEEYNGRLAQNFALRR